MDDSSDLDVETRRAIWRSRRGLLELDLLLPPFARERYRTLDPTLRAAYHRLLTCEDTDIWAWLQRRTAPEDRELERIVDEVRAFGAGSNASAR